ncbi:ABC transporter permease [Peribacillus sp. SCS-37]|uniref:ABC transporter permease n=1 Tax=Paraperibacillus esterisolvens TaxID=3115296 RepID=UPI00390670B2
MTEPAIVQEIEGNHLAPERKRDGLKVLKRLIRNPWALLGVILVLGTVICAFFAPYIAPFTPTEASLRSRLDPPMWLDSTSSYLLGGDQIGRDLLSRIIYGARISLLVGICGVLLSMTIGVVLGLIAGYYGKWLDDFIMRIADVQLAFPFILFAIVIMSVLGGGISKIILILGLTYWVGFARLVRGQVLAIKEIEFIQAARATGSTDFQIIVKHILPNIASSILVLSTLYIAEFILLEASLTFLGLGVDPTIPSWGGMLADSRNYMSTAWWVATFPGLAILLTVLGFNLLGDWLRDELDPNLNV